MAWSEDRMHRWLATRARPRVLAGSRGHDAAVLRELGGRTVVCVDACIEGVHFEAGTSPGRVGRKAVGRALSDLAATAARPRALLVAIVAPCACTEKTLRALILGAIAAGREHGAELVGGDLCAGRGPLSITVTALGVFPARRRPPGRDRARVGQRVVVTGPCGGSILGRHLRIAARVAEGQALCAAGATALMDVSDGLAWDLHRLARASGVAIEIEADAIPIHRDARRLALRTRRSPLDHALHDGEDHELIATLPARAPSQPWHTLGLVARGSGLWITSADGKRRLWTHAAGGFEHGG
ncbi:MAG: thiamine-monophosphate kinase [Planctomycetes bacterium]|nr:thiamine-monophosphate kinase [Planctomycetota bacterium]